MTDTTELAAGWHSDPSLTGRLRYWDGGRWTSHVSSNGETYEEPYLGKHETRWQFGVVNIGVHFAVPRMMAVLQEAGEQGWQLISIYDKTTSFMPSVGAEKGFMLFKRPVPAGVRLEEAQWCITFSMVGKVPH